MKTGFEIAVFAGWLLCIISLVSVGRHPTADFQGIRRSEPCIARARRVAGSVGVTRGVPERRCPSTARVAPPPGG